LALKQRLLVFIHNHVSRAAAEWLWGNRRSSQSWMAAYTLGAMPPDPKIRDGLVEALRRANDPNEDSNIAFYAAEGLAARYTNEWKKVVPALREALLVPHDNVQVVAARGLSKFGIKGIAALPEMISLLGRSTNSYLCSGVAGALGIMGSPASNAIPSLQTLVTNQEPEVRRCAAVAIWRISPTNAFPKEVLLTNMQKGIPLQERAFAAHQLWKDGHTGSPEVVATLVDVIKSPPEMFFGQPNHGPRMCAAQFLGTMGAEAKAGLPALIEAETDQVEFVRKVAKEARKKIDTALAGQTPISP
jgi:HEAT repeat protein